MLPCLLACMTCPGHLSCGCAVPGGNGCGGLAPYNSSALLLKARARPLPAPTAPQVLSPPGESHEASAQRLRAMVSAQLQAVAAGAGINPKRLRPAHVATLPGCVRLYLLLDVVHVGAAGSAIDGSQHLLKGMAASISNTLQERCCSLSWQRPLTAGLTLSSRLFASHLIRVLLALAVAIMSAAGAAAARQTGAAAARAVLEVAEGRMPASAAAAAAVAPAAATAWRQTASLPSCWGCACYSTPPCSRATRP
jgi:hypothetical protein